MKHLKTFKIFEKSNEDDASHITCPVCNDELTTFSDSIYSDEVEEYVHKDCYDNVTHNTIYCKICDEYKGDLLDGDICQFCLNKQNKYNNF